MFSVGRLGKIQHLPNDGLAAHRNHQRPTEAIEPLEFAVDPQVVIALLGEVDAGIEHDRLARQPRRFRHADLFRTDPTVGFCHPAHHREGGGEECRLYTLTITLNDTKVHSYNITRI